ncbi:hypothetical protein HZY83_04025 [Gemella sp. GH3]|nr:hypothetical protein [Gemella sp. GH3.1]NYS50800.1 hypothetical protein [Gemella sp. GH3]
MELKKIVQYFWVIKLPLVLLFLFFSIVGIIENYAFIDVNRGIRYSFGAIYATDFASSIFYIYMAYLYIKNNIKLYDVFFGILLAVFLDIYTDARLSVFLIYMASILFYLVDKKYVKILKKFISRTYMKFIFIIMFLISFITSYLYNASNINWYNFNKMLSNRLYLGNRSLSNYDITLFGQKIEMQGNGWTLKEWDSSLGYNFIDSSYLQWLLIYGIIFATTMLILFTLSYFRAISINDYKLVLCLMLIAISGFVEQHILNIVNNPFIFAIVPIIFMDRKEVEFNYEKS